MEKDRLQKKGNTWDGLKRSISYVEISLIVHVTEDLQKALVAVRNLFPNPYDDNISFKKENLWGHHKNLIIFVKTTIRKKNRIYALIKAFIQRLDNKKMFFLRLDKQKAYLGKIKLSTIDPILIKIKLNFYPNNFKEIINPNK
jgi:RNA binding exosome subunit